MRAGVPDRLATVVDELIRRPVDLIATYGTPPTRIADADHHDRDRRARRDGRLLRTLCGNVRKRTKPIIGSEPAIPSDLRLELSAGELGLGSRPRRDRTNASGGIAAPTTTAIGCPRV
jgi:hypothetical protein